MSRRGLFCSVGSGLATMLVSPARALAQGVDRFTAAEGNDIAPFGAAGAALLVAGAAAILIIGGLLLWGRRRHIQLADRLDELDNAIAARGASYGDRSNHKGRQ